MARTARVAPGGLVYHVLNRTVGRMKMFGGERDYQAFERVMLEAYKQHPLRVLAYCLMPSHWHFVVWPEKDGQLSGFFRWLAHTHAMRWRVSHHTVGYGHLYQGRFKSFPVQRDEHLLSVCRYVERNALAAELCERAEEWRWSSLWARRHSAEAGTGAGTGAGATSGAAAGTEALARMLVDWPVHRPADWVARVNRAMTRKELERVKMSVERSRPYGSDVWVARTAGQLGLEHTMRREGRPRKKAK